MIDIVENSFGKSWYDKDKLILHETYNGMVDFDLAIEVVTSIKSFVEKNPVKGELIDLTAVKGTFTAINDYLEKEFFPFIIAQGCIAIGIIFSNDVFTQYAINDIIKRVKATEIQVFDNLDNATQWVENKVSA